MARQRTRGQGERRVRVVVQAARNTAQDGRLLGVDSTC
jgi:hypothetical protein